MIYISHNVYKYGRYVNASGRAGFPSKRYPLLAQGLGAKAFVQKVPLLFFFAADDRTHQITRFHCYSAGMNVPVECHSLNWCRSLVLRCGAGMVWKGLAVEAPFIGSESPRWA